MEKADDKTSGHCQIAEHAEAKYGSKQEEFKHAQEVPKVIKKITIIAGQGHKKAIYSLRKRETFFSVTFRRKRCGAQSTFHAHNYRPKRLVVKGKIDFFLSTCLHRGSDIGLISCRTLRKRRPKRNLRQKCLKRWGYGRAGVLDHLWGSERPATSP